MSGSSQKRATGSIAITSDQFRDDCRNAGGRHVARSFCNDGAALRCHSFSTASRIGTANLPWEPSRKIALVWGLRTEYGLNESEVVAVRRFLETLAVNIPGRSRTCNLRLRRPTLYPIELRGHGLCGHSMAFARRFSSCSITDFGRCFAGLEGCGPTISPDRFVESVVCSGCCVQDVARPRFWYQWNSRRNAGLKSCGACWSQLAIS